MRACPVFLCAGICLVSHGAQAGDLLVGERNGLSFDAFVTEMLADYGVPGAVVAVVDAGKVPVSVQVGAPWSGDGAAGGGAGSSATGADLFRLRRKPALQPAMAQ